MPRNLTIISVRLTPDTILLLDKLTADHSAIQRRNSRPDERVPYNRSQIIRHALTAGLDVLTQQPPLEL